METISNEEKAIEFATSYDGKIISFAHLAALQAMQYKDEQHEAEKQQWIDKAVQFINDKLQGKHIEWKDEYCWSLGCFIKQFKQAMEE